jgi:hypothetical protein
MGLAPALMAELSIYSNTYVENNARVKKQQNTT